ncbi:MAG: zinc ribbon domain-containing protein [Candidatus Ornithomonoglobus sp.]
MDEQLFEKIKSGAYRTKDNAGRWAKEVAKRTSNAVTHAKLAFAVNETNSKVKDIYAEIGKTIYADYLDGKEASEELKPSLEQIDKLMEEIEALNAKIAELKNSLKCPECGAFNATDAGFCSKCGTPLEAEASDAEYTVDEAFAQAEAEDSAPEPDEDDDDEVIIINPKKPE